MTAQLGWLWDDNLHVFLEFVACLVSYDLDPEELKIHLAEAFAADPEREVWYSVVMNECTLHLGRDGGTAVVQIKADGPRSLTAKLSVLVSFLANYSAVVRR